MKNCEWTCLPPTITDIRIKWWVRAYFKITKGKGVPFLNYLIGGR